MLPDLPTRPFDVILESLPYTNNYCIPKNSGDYYNPNVGKKSIVRQDEIDNDDENDTTDSSLSSLSSLLSIWQDAIQQSKDDKFKILSWDTIGHNSLSPSLQKTPYLTETNTETQEAVFQIYLQNELVPACPLLSKSDLMRDIYYLVIGFSSKLFSYNPELRMFQIITNFRISGCSEKAMNRILIKFLDFGTYIKRLENVAKRCIQDRSAYGLTGIAFGHSLLNVVTFIRLSITSLAEKYEGLKKMNLIRFYFTIDESFRLLEYLASFCCCDRSNTSRLNLTSEQKQNGFYIPFGAAIISKLYVFSQRIDASQSYLLKSVFLALLAESSYTYFQMMNSWIGLNALPSPHLSSPTSSSSSVLSLFEKSSLFYQTTKGKFSDPYQEFFIQNSDDGYGQQQKIKVSKSNPLPAFISVELARNMLAAGISLRLLRDCRPNHPLCNNNDNNSGGQQKGLLFQWDKNVKWIFTQGEIYDMHERLQVYMRDMMVAIIAQDNKRKASTARIKANYERVMSKRKEEHNITESLEKSDHFNFDESPGDPSTITSNNQTIELIELLHKAQTSSSVYKEKDYIPPLRAITDLVINYPISSQCRLINASILSIFFHELDLVAHLNVLRNFLLLGNGNFVSGLTDALFSDNVDYGEDFSSNKATSGSSGNGNGIRLNSRRTWPPDSVEWRMALKSVIVETILLEKENSEVDEDQDGDNSTREPSIVDAWSSINNLDDILMFGIQSDEEYSLEALDFLYLDYKPPYPINVVITPNSLTKYKNLFTFLLRVLRLDTVVHHIYRLSHSRYSLMDEKNDKGDTLAQKKLLHIFRFEAQQFMIALHGYVFDNAIASTWTLFLKRLSKISKNAEFEIPRQQQQQHGNRATTTASSEAQSINEEENNDDEDNHQKDVKDLESLRAYHEHVLDRMLYQCMLKKKHAPLMKILNAILSVILSFAQKLQQRRTTVFYDASQRQEHWNTIQTLYDRFRLYTTSLMKLLLAFEEKGGGRMGIGVKRQYYQGGGKNDAAVSHTSNDVDLHNAGRWYHDKADSQSGVKGFMQELLVRLDSNGHYKKLVKKGESNLH
ncbi:9017_t:CDS:10 [Ambispora leptoticha]|uniref:Spindle pole body component n=1 Tax=Ambispora leptoticha TaxID=144679 RepID=A0A9N9F870_9GLOM|nr:9017_t:CDS:10 [Ambispora leptoticha]